MPPPLKGIIMKQKASEIYNWLKDAVSDAAQGELFPKEDWTAIENKADELFHDKATIRDLIGDQIYDAIGGPIRENKFKALALCLALKNISHREMNQVMDDLIQEYNLYRPFTLDKKGFLEFLRDHGCEEEFKKEYSESDWHEGVPLDTFLEGEPSDFLNSAFFWDDADRNEFWYNLSAKWEGYFEEE